MANSSAHLLGQTIGNILEKALLNYLYPIAQRYNLYLDYKHPRMARGGQAEVIWIDINQNKHKLDIVFEQRGSEECFGEPVAFIEIAWRKYTKHSKNKVQEISGAILPLINEHRRNLPFYGAVLAGVFTENSIQQLRSEGFRVVYFHLPTIESAFSLVGIDAHWEENTPEDILLAKVNQIKQLNDIQLQRVIEHILGSNSLGLETFCASLCQCLERRIISICISPLYGSAMEFYNLDDACNFILNLDNFSSNAPLVKFEISI